MQRLRFGLVPVARDRIGEVASGQASMAAVSVIATRGRFIIRGSCSVGGSGQACADRRADRMIPCRLQFKCTVALQMAIGEAICAVQFGCSDYFHSPSVLSTLLKTLYWLGVDSFYFLLAIG
ncbi:hypothetical protein ACNRBH_24975 [Ralstonia pseudosolanacearum]|uniref:hypothetical protein n=1 Tax=Ralstonia pseudosolanacearum TaxID=1310165 RepID=UPI0026754CAD|nr:hypothetical protein [Ralstonia pseudosolanacearum]MDO3526755.1 hypothetical protein [Ralstonia pseudosolanacearum]MDO3534060.1 hypothetical protein [Ralstonia pseudosolanacearum]